MLGLLLVMLCTAAKRYQESGAPGLGEVIRQYAAQQTGEKLLKQFVPAFSYAEQVTPAGTHSLVQQPIEEIMPLYAYGVKEEEESARTENRITIEMILQAEGMEGEGTEISDELSATAAQEGGQLSDNGTMQNEGALFEAAETGTAETGAIPGTEELTALMEQENQTITQISGQFVPHSKQTTVDMAGLADYETLVKSFYTISSDTMIGSDQLNVEALNSRDLKVSKDAPGPQILIYHTHSQEMFADSVPGDTSTSIVGVGQRLTDILTNQYGYQVLHHTGEYDVESRDDAYSRSLPAIEQVLEENPTIQVVIDLHRDGVDEGTRLVMDMDGRPTARFMFFNGLSRTRKTGNISYLHNENLEGNLAFSFQMQKAAMEYYPGLTRKIFLKGYRYNMHLRERNLLVELGAQNNTVEEAMNACDPLAHLLDIVLSGQQ